jgi:N-carbamoylputrescine amidase
VRVTITELAGTSPALERGWAALAEHVRTSAPDLVVLPEAPFAEPFWLEPRFDAARWQEMVRRHEEWCARVGELGAPAVVATRLVERDGRRLNEAFVWTAAAGLVPLRSKAFLPEEPGGHEATWTDRGPDEFPLAEIAGAACAVNVCTELWHLPSLAGYAARGVEVVLSSRATGARTMEKWLAIGRVAAVASGAYCASSNRADADGRTGGSGFAFDPDGELIARTSPERPFVTLELDLERARAAKRTYPRYVFAPPGSRPAPGPSGEPAAGR